MAMVKKSLSKPSSQYFHATSHERRADPVGDVVRGEAMVMVELKTNLRIEDELAFVTDLSHYLAKRYNRSVESMIVTVDHSRCMLFAGKTDPAYTMAISALPSEVQQATNKRNTAVIQRFMETALGVSAERGFIQFVPVGEECVGWGGKTVLGRIGDAGGRVSLEQEERSHDRRALRTISLRKSAAPIEATPPRTPSRNTSHTGSTISSPPLPLPSTPSGHAPMEKVVRKRKSLRAAFFRSSKYESDMETIPQEGP